METRHFFQLLKKRQEALLERVNSERAQLAAQSPAAQGDVGDFGDSSVLDANADDLLQLSDTDRSEALEIGYALERLQRGTYGHCEQCSEDIGFARLEQLPHARLCIECQTGVEERPHVSQLHGTQKL